MFVPQSLRATNLILPLQRKGNSVSIAPDIDSHNSGLPKHIAIIMDGNNRWAKANSLLGGSGHKAGETALQKIVEHAAKRRIDVLTVFAFSSENWRRPEQEVGFNATFCSCFR